MAAITLEDFRIDYPEFDSVQDARIERAIVRASARIDETVFGNLYEEATGLYAAYLLSISLEAENTANTQGVASLSLGKVKTISTQGEGSVTYADAPSDSAGGKGGSAELQDNPYGQRFETLKRSVLMPSRIV